MAVQAAVRINAFLFALGVILPGLTLNAVVGQLDALIRKPEIQEGQRQTAEREDRCIAQRLDKLLRHREAVLIALTQIKAQGVERPVSVLHREGPVKAHAFSCFLDDLLRDGHALGVELFHRRVAGREIHQQKRQETDGDQDADKMQQFLNGEGIDQDADHSAESQQS